MTYDIIHKNSTVSGTPPAAGDIDVGEIAINAADVALYVKDTNGDVKNVVTDALFTQAGSGAVQRTVESKLQDVVSVLDFIPQGEHAAIKAGTSTYNCSPAFNAALTASDFVFVPKGGYRIESTILIKAGQKLIGTGRSTVLKGYVPAPNPIVRLGADVGSLNYYPALESCQINQYTPNGVAVLLFETCGGTVKDIFVNGEVNSGCIAFVIDGHDNSSFFNLLQNCYALHCHIGFNFISTGSSFSTQNILIDCSVFGDLVYGDTTSIGYKFTQNPNGQDTCVYGGNLEQCGIGIKLETTNKISFHGVRFEANTEDINMNALVSACSFINCRNINVATGAPGAQDGYGNNTFFACDGTFGANNHIEADNSYWSKGATATPIRITGYTNQTAPLAQWFDSTSSELGHIQSSGGFFTNSNVRSGAASSEFTWDPNAAVQLASGDSSRLRTSYRYTGNPAGNYMYTGYNGASFVVANESNVGVYLLHGGTSWTSLSDERAKTIIEPIQSALSKVEQLRSVIYYLNSDKDKTRKAGLIAQDVQNVLPEAVQEDKDGILGLTYTEVIPLLVAAINELKALVEAAPAST